MLGLLLAVSLAAAGAPPKKSAGTIDPNTLYAMHWDRPSYRSCEPVDMNATFDDLMAFLDSTPQVSGRVYSYIQGRHFTFVVVFVDRSKGQKTIYNRVLASDPAYCLANHARFKEEAERLEETGKLDHPDMQDVTDQLIGPRPPLNLEIPRL